MLLRRRFPGLSAAVAGSLRRSLTTAAARIPWAMMGHNALAVEAPSAQVRLVEPPRISQVYVPEHLVQTRPPPDPASDVVQGRCGSVCSASGDGLLLLVYAEVRLTARVVARQSDLQLRQLPEGFDPDDAPDVTRIVFNPVTHQLSRLPPRVTNFDGAPLLGVRMGLLTQADGGHGPPDRFAVAELPVGDLMLRFLSEKDKWETVVVSPCQVPSARRIEIHQEVLAFRGRLWWFDETCGAISVDPFSDRPELSFVELPRGSVLPAGARGLPTHKRPSIHLQGSPMSDGEDDGNVWWHLYRRVGVSEGRLRYVEVTLKEPFLLSSFALDEDGSGWTLEHRVALNKLWADGGYPWLPLTEGKTPQIGLLHPLNASVVYIKVDRHVIVVDMNIREVIASYLYKRDFCPIPCVLAPWLGSSRIPSAGKKDTEKNKTLADVLVRSDIP